MTQSSKDIKLIFAEALEKQTSDERKAYLNAVCNNNSSLLRKVEALLKAYEDADDVPDSPIIDLGPTIEDMTCAEQPGSIIGHYKILEKIGEGGMASVFMAEQKQPIRRRVALKIIKLGMDTKAVIGRFEAERQALAMMDHPNIAHIYDAGTTKSGRPYFVMELVRGVSITEFCDKNNLTTLKRLELFISVCKAVQHAHQKGIIHRDIKPSNVMVTLHDGEPVPKVIDFGIAKAVNQQLTEKTVFTRYAQMIGTPEYMSPEQAEMSGLDIDIRTDVFSLGTLLYELLTGSPPFDSEHLLSKGYEEMQRIIREEEPTKPSTKISTLGEALINVAKCRATSPDVLQKLFRADLDWIVMKTLEKNRNRRYDSVSEFAADIKRYLNNEPVLAGPPSSIYRINKFIKRHHVLVAACTAVVAVVIMGFVISTTLYLRMSQAINTVSKLEDKFDVYKKFSTVQRLSAEGQSQAALNEIEAMLKSQNLGLEALLLRARLLVEVGQLKEAKAQLIPLTKEEPDIAGAAHYLLAQVNMGMDTDKVKEHEALAASMLPETAEAYALRAMTASSMEQALQWLDKAITLDPTHYPSRKARMLIYYIQGQDQKMVEDATALIVLRPADSLGYTVRAILRRESGRFEEALVDHTHAIELCESEKELIEAYEQRYETYTKMGDHTGALEDARRLVELDQNNFWHRFRIVTSLIALEDFTAAQQEYRTIVQTSYHWDRSIRRNLAYYVFDILGAGQTLTFPQEIIQQAPFAQIQRVAECYYALVSKATHFPLPRQGVSPYAWSPDGKQLLCGWWGLYGALRQIIEGAVPTISEYAGLKIIDIESGEERFVAEAHGGIPSWSPDGKYIAYPDLDQNLYIFSLEDNQSRKIASAFWTQWSNDSQHLYYKADFGLGDIYSININDPHMIPKKLMSCPGSFAICESESWIAFGKPTGIDLLDLSSGSILYQWSSIYPQNGWALSFSPNGRELAVRSWYPHVDAGPFILDTQYKRLYRILDYPVGKLIWSPDGSKLAIGAKRDIWIMDIDPNLPTYEALGILTSETELVYEEIDKRNQAIEANPLYLENYLRRALAYMSIGKYQMAESDLQQFDALVTSDDHHLGYEIFWWLRQCYKYELYKQIEFLIPHAEKLMERFPSDVPSYRDLIEEIVEINSENGRNELAEQWKTKLRDLDKKDM